MTYPTKLPLTSLLSNRDHRESPATALDTLPSRGTNCAATVTVDMPEIKHNSTPLPARSWSRGERRPSRFWSRLRAGSEEGSALVEFAVTLPLLMLVVTGITTFGIALNNYLQLTEAVGIGGQQLAVSRGNTLNPCSTAAAAIEGAAPYLAPASLSITLTLNGTSYGPYAGNTTWSSTTCASTSNTTGAAANLVQGQPATILATYPCTLAVFGINYAPTCNLSAQVTEIVQ